MLDLVISQEATLLEALDLINKTAQGIAFVVGPDKKMTGVLTDGDIRRALLRGSPLQTPVAEVMKRDFVALPVTTPVEQIAKTLSERIAFIPLLDEKGCPVDYASYSRLHRIPVSEPSLQGKELAYVIECLKTNWISSQGRFVTQFEKMFSDYHAGLPALAVSNGTVALHLALVTLGVGPGDEVLVPDLTFAATANTVIHAGAKPVLVDVNKSTWTLDPECARKAITPRTRAMIPVHLYGHPCDMDPLLAIAREHRLFVIEDCAEGLGATYKNQRVGALGDAGCFSFFGNKLITTGEGGMIVFKNPAAYQKAKILRDHGMSPERRYWHDQVGYNYRLTNLQAAIGVAQMEQMNHFIARKIEIAAQYQKALKGIAGIQFPQTAAWAKNVYWLYTIRIGSELGISRDDLIYKLLQNGIDTRPLFYPLHTMPPYKEFATQPSYAAANEISDSGLSLPSAVTLVDEEFQRITQAFARILNLRDFYEKASHT